MNMFINFIVLLLLFVLWIVVIIFLLRFAFIYFKNNIFKIISIVFIIILGILTFISFTGYQKYQEGEILDREESVYDITEYCEGSIWPWDLPERVVVSSEIDGQNYKDITSIHNRKKLDKKDLSENTNDYIIKKVEYTLKRKYFPFLNITKKSYIVEYHIIKE